MIKTIKEKIKDPYRLFGIAMIAFVLICYVILMMHNGYRYLNADDSSELVLARILAEQHNILTKDWCYSSELRVLNTNLIFAPMFMIFRSWKAVRIAGGILLMLLYVISYLWIPRAWKYESRWFYLTAFILIMPYAEPWYFFGLKMYYIPHVTITFLSFALLGYIYNADTKVKTGIYTTLLALLAFGAGLGGARSVEYTYIPLFICALLAWFVKKGRISTLIATFTAVAASAAGYLVNDKILAKIYDYHSYLNVSFIRPSFEMLEWALDAVLASFGYIIGEYFVSFGGICNAIAVVMTALFFMVFILVWRKRGELSQTESFIYLFATITFLLNTFVMTLGQNDEYADRYISIGMVPAIMLMGMIYKLYIERMERARAISAMMIAVFLILGARGYLNLIHYSGNGNRLGYINFLEENGYDYGYATFWNANITTEMTDGRIDMTSLDPNAEDLKVFRWLTDKRLIDEPHDRTFLVLENDEAGMYKGSEPVYSDDCFRVYNISSGDIIPSSQLNHETYQE